MDKKYDVGIIGLWYGRNYGSMATYYALHQTIKKMGYSILMIDNPLRPDEEITITKTHPYKLARMFYNVSEKKRLSTLHELNKECKAFMVGSDQLWNVGLSRPYKQMYYLDFVDNSTRKLAYGTSFGKQYAGTEEERFESSKNLQRFDNVSVRDSLSAEICRDKFGVNAVQVCDPTFLCDVSEYDALAEKANLNETEPYILAYVLDPNPEIGKQLETLSIEKNSKVIVLLDESPRSFENNKNNLQLSGNGNVEIKSEVDIFEWMWYYKNASSVFTDSFHGTIFSIIFRKPFISLINHKRGAQRFISLLEPIDLKYRLFDTPQCITENKDLLDSCDYTVPSEKLNKIKQDSYDWLKNSLAGTQKPTAITPVNTPAVVNRPVPAVNQTKPFDYYMFDLNRCKLVVTLLKQYGIDHVVLSSGGRNIHLVYLFEADPFFKTYSVIDERSAGFFALGLSLKLNKPVAMCCTSGTATSNYLTSVTEAYYQHVPLVVVTADRYPCYLGQNEDQTIPQTNIFNGVVKKSVSIPVSQGPLAEWEARRLVCDALLEVNHRGKGPVHINIPVLKTEGPKPSPSVLKLNKKFHTIERITLEDSDAVWKRRVEKLKSMNRIILFYGQNHPLSPEEKRSVEAFAEKFNCIIAVDNYSNFQSKYAVSSTPILKNIDNNTYNNKLWANVIITVGGRRAFNDPTLVKFRHQTKPLGHWRVAEDGEVVDTYRKLSRIFECSPKYFFDKFVKLAGDSKNNGEYLKLWQEEQKKVPSPHAEEYYMRYAIERLVTNIPDNSLLHLGLGSTVAIANMFKINPTVNVFANLGTNGIDGPGSTFMGQVAVSDELCFLVLSDLSFFYDMNSIWSKNLKGNVRIMLCNNDGSGLLRHHKSPSITHAHHTSAEGWVKSVGFEYLSSHNAEEFDKNLEVFLSDIDKPLFFEVFC